MKGFNKGVIAGALMIFALVIAFSVSQSYASQNVQKMASKAVSDFFDAGKNNDANGVINNSIDTGTEKERRDLFAKTQKDFKGYQILAVKKQDDNKVFVTVKLSITPRDAIMKYPVVKMGNKWMVDVANATQIEDRLPQ